MNKRAIQTVPRRNQVINNILNALDRKSSFLLLGHKNPDEDCIASLVAFSLLVTKFEKEARICIPSNLHEHYQYLLDICRHNSIGVEGLMQVGGKLVDTIVVCDTPKSSMIQTSEQGFAYLSKKDTLKIEIDHHLEADSEYIGDEGYRLVTEASSACELIGLLALKLCHREDLIKKYNMIDLFSRNFVLCVLTGIIADTQMGKFFKSNREKRFYQIFSTIFNKLLTEKTVKDGNYSTKEDVFKALRRLSSGEKECYEYILGKKRFSDYTGYVVLTAKEMERLFNKFDQSTVVSVVRAATDALAEESGFFGIIAYYDDPQSSDLIQFKMRRSQSFRTYDLRKLLEMFSIENGGGHAGAIGFRIASDQIKDLDGYMQTLIQGVENSFPR